MDVAYGESHPKEARDTDGPCRVNEYFHTPQRGCKAKKRRGAPPNSFPHQSESSNPLYHGSTLFISDQLVSVPPAATSQEFYEFLPMVATLR